MRTFLAGCDGMIGSNVLKILYRQSCALTLADLRRFNDLRNPKNCLAAMGCRVFDCAAPTRGIGSDDFLDAARIPLNLLSCHPEHFIYLSSSCVYPDDASLPTPEEEGFRGEPEAANRGYGWAKRVGELACQYSGVPCTIVRASNIYGPSYNWNNPKKHVIPSLITRMLTGENPLIVWGSGHQTRSFMYEEDCAQLVVALSPYEGTFNLGGDETSIGELTKILVELTKYKGQVIFDTDKPIGPQRKCQSTKRMESILGKIVSTPLEQGLRKTIEATRDTAKNYRLGERQSQGQKSSS